MSERAVATLALSVAPTRALSPAMKTTIVSLCSRAFGRDFGNLFDFVTASMHVLAHQDHVLFGHACWTMRWLEPEGFGPLETAYVDAVATEPEFQGCGIGSAVI